MAHDQPFRPFYLMIKPAAAVARSIDACPRADRRRADLRHITLLPVGERRVTPGRLEQVIASLETFEAPACRVVFDTIHDSGHTVALRGSETMWGVQRLQAALRAHLFDDGIVLPRYGFNPHITLAYRSDGLGTEAIDPISWLVEEVLLIESIYGEGQHIVHGRWSLRVLISA